MVGMVADDSFNAVGNALGQFPDGGLLLVGQPGAIDLDQGWRGVGAPIVWHAYPDQERGSGPQRQLGRGGGKRGRQAEEINKNAPVGRLYILVQDQRDLALVPEGFQQRAHGALLGDGLLPSLVAQAVEQGVDPGILDGGGHAGQRITLLRDAEAQDLPVAHVGGQADQGAGLEDAFLVAGIKFNQPTQACGAVPDQPEAVEERQCRDLHGSLQVGTVLRRGFRRKGHLEVRQGNLAQAAQQQVDRTAQEAGQGQQRGPGHTGYDSEGQPGRGILNGTPDRTQQVIQFQHGQTNSNARASVMDARLSGEPGGDRTRDQQIKSLLLYQLSYRPVSRDRNGEKLADE